MNDQKSISPTFIFFASLVVISIYGSYRFALDSAFIKNGTVETICYIFFSILIVLSPIQVYDNMSWTDYFGDGKIVAVRPELYLPENRMGLIVTSFFNSITDIFFILMIWFGWMNTILINIVGALLLFYSFIRYMRIIKMSTGPVSRKIGITKAIVYFAIIVGVIGRLINWNEQVF